MCTRVVFLPFRGVSAFSKAKSFFAWTPEVRSKTVGVFIRQRKTITGVVTSQHYLVLHQYCAVRLVDREQKRGGGVLCLPVRATRVVVGGSVLSFGHEIIMKGVSFG